jgi:hypothetical protein
MARKTNPKGLSGSKGAVKPAPAKPAKRPEADFKPLKLQAVLRSYQAKEAKAGETKRIVGKWAIDGADFDTLTKLCKSPAHALKIIRAADEPGDKVTVKTDTDERAVKLTPTGSARSAESPSVVFKKLTFIRDAKGDHRAEITFVESGLKDLATFYFEHIGYEVEIESTLKQSNFDFDDDKPAKSGKDKAAGEK